MRLEEVRENLVHLLAFQDLCLHMGVVPEQSMNAEQHDLFTVEKVNRHAIQDSILLTAQMDDEHAALHRCGISHSPEMLAELHLRGIKDMKPYLLLQQIHQVFHHHLPAGRYDNFHEIFILGGR